MAYTLEFRNYFVLKRYRFLLQRFLLILCMIKIFRGGRVVDGEGEGE